jgi:type IV pilus assembly protein PilE
MSRSRGFTLIELMIVIGVIAIIAIIALPSYQEQVRKGRRAEAARSVGQLQLELERWRAENPSYADCGAPGCGSGTYPALPVSDYYTSAINSADATSYSVTATPKGAQTGDRCGNLRATLPPSDIDGDGDLDHKPAWTVATCN